MIKRIFNFCWSHCMLWFPLLIINILIIDLQRYLLFFSYYNNHSNAIAMIPLYTFFIYFSANIEILQHLSDFELTGWLTQFFLPLVSLISYPVIIKYLNKTMKIIILFILYPFIVLTSNYLISFVGYLILQAFGLTARDNDIRQKKNITAITRNGVKLNSFELFERNIVKVVCLSFFIVTFIYYFIKKEVLWDKICDTVVE